MDEGLFPEDEPSIGYTDAERGAMVATLRSLSADWRPAVQPLGLTPKDWQPTLRRGKEVVHLHTVEELSKPWIERMTLARDAGYRVLVAAPEEMWGVAGTLIAVDQVGASPIVLRRNGDSERWDAFSHESVTKLVVVGTKVLLDRSTRSTLGLRALDRAAAAKKADSRGRLFEAFLAFLFSQVSYLEVFSSNYRNDTEEIDIVLRNRQTAGGALPRSPLILVSAKNEKKPVGVPALTSLEAKMRNRRGQCGFGMLCCTGRFAGSVSEHLLRGSREPQVVALLDGAALRDLLQAENIGSALEAAATKAALT